MPVPRMPSDIGCRFRAGSPDAIGRQMPVLGQFLGCRRCAAERRMSVRRLPPSVVGCRAATGPLSLDAGPVLVLVGQNLYMWLDNLHS